MTFAKTFCLTIGLIVKIVYDVCLINNAGLYASDYSFIWRVLGTQRSECAKGETAGSVLIQRGNKDNKNLDNIGIPCTGKDD